MTAVRAKLLLITLGVAFGHACNGGPCDERFPAFATGDYLVTKVVGQTTRSDDAMYPWLQGAQVHVDRAARFMTIRYQRDGSTYEVRYTLTAED